MAEIHELILRLPGLSPAEARQLGDDVAQRLAREIPDTSRRTHIDQIALSLPQENAGGRAGLADSITRQIINQLNLK